MIPACGCRGKRAPSLFVISLDCPDVVAWSKPYIHSDSDYATQANWVTKSNTSLPSFEYSSCDWLIHTTLFHSNRYHHRAVPKHGILVNIASFFKSQIHGHISPYTSGILLYWKQKISLYFCASTWEHL